MGFGEVDIVPASDGDLEIIRTLWREYWCSQGLAPDFQGFADELRDLPGAYAPPRGRLLVARVGGVPAGTAALRALNKESCEAKRLYVRPQFRASGLGRALLTELIGEARAAGYKQLYGDTLPSMSSALRMYRQFGFVEVNAYSADPTPGAVFLRMTL